MTVVGTLTLYHPDILYPGSDRIAPLSAILVADCICHPSFNIILKCSLLCANACAIVTNDITVKPIFFMILSL